MDNNYIKIKMKFSVFIALVGIAAATQRHNHNSFIQTKFIDFSQKDEEDVMADSPAPAPVGKTPTKAEAAMKAEIDAKAAKIAAATKEIEKTEEADAVMTNKEKAAAAKKLKAAEAKAAEKLEAKMNSEDDAACAKKKAGIAAEKAAKAAEAEAERAATRPNPGDSDWVRNMPDEILSGEKFAHGPLKYANWTAWNNQAEQKTRSWFIIFKVVGRLIIYNTAPMFL